MRIRKILVTSFLSLSVILSACGSADSQATPNYKLMPNIKNICDGSTGYVNYELIFLQNGMYMINETPYFAEEDREGNNIFPEDSWLNFEKPGVTWEIYFLNTQLGDHESFSGLIGYENEVALTNPNGVEYVFAIDAQGNAGLVRENGKCLETGNASLSGRN